MEATPRPWVVGAYPSCPTDILGPDCVGDPRMYVARVGPWKDNKKHHPIQEEAEANAALIVKAVNCHEKLVEALELAEATLQRLAPNGARATQGTRDVIRAALAEGE